MENFANNAATSLSATIDNAVTTLVVTSAAKFPSTAQFRILIDSEYMLVTAISGTTWTVTRGSEGSTAVTHRGGSTVKQVVTAATYANFKQTLSVNTASVATSGTVTVPVTSDSIDITATGSFTLSLIADSNRAQRTVRVFNNSGAAITIIPDATISFGLDLTELPLVAAGKVAILGFVYRTLNSANKWDFVASANGF